MHIGQPDNLRMLYSRHNRQRAMVPLRIPHMVAIMPLEVSRNTLVVPCPPYLPFQLHRLAQWVRLAVVP
jgi:hypothetical protein